MELKTKILEISGALDINGSEAVQTLWSGYGEIRRYKLSGGIHPSIIVKHIKCPELADHPRGWNTEVSHQRKLTSYKVEQTWYQQYAELVDRNCKVPKCYHTMKEGSELLLILEDLNAIGYDQRWNQDNVTVSIAKNCLKWLAHFHARFLDNDPKGLWPIGTYWHLGTRLDEWERMKNLRLKESAQAINNKLCEAEYQTLVHGDAKLANFCFNHSGEVAAVDFQYVGKGCGIKDVAYFIGSCFDEAACEQYERELLQSYFEELKVATSNYSDFQALKEEWQELYKYAWADFYRFLDGWSPGHWKMNAYSKRISDNVIKELES